MKTHKFYILTAMIWFVAGFLATANSQQLGVFETTKENRIVAPFTSIEAADYFNIILEQSNETKVVVETEPKFQDEIKVNVTNGVLNLGTLPHSKFKVLNLYITTPEIRKIVLNGNSSLKSKGMIEASNLVLETYGTAILSLNLDVDNLETESHGASEIILDGRAVEHLAVLHGASKLIASKLIVDNTSIETNALTNAFVNTKNELNITSNDNSSVEYQNIPAQVNRKNPEKVYREYKLTLDERDEARLDLGRFNVQFNDSRDSTTVKIGRHWFIVDEYGNARYRRMYRDKFNSNWAGVLLGINGYLTPDHNMDFPQEYNYLDLNLAKSIRVDINIFEQNIRFTRDNRFGMATGLGFEIRSYHFDRSVSLIGTEPSIEGYYNEGIYISKSKLVATYLNLPFILEYQTNSYSNRDSFHISAGMVFGLRIGSHTKIKFEEKNKEYALIDPVSGNPAYVKTSPERKRYKEFGSYHLNPFKADAMFMIGWGWINLYATYSLTTLFKEDQGPELYPFSIGLSLLKW